ncbi:MAG: hypothetical protein ACYS47_07460 [Planctomycetota bacterium]|jgi:hypothetical protein
MPAPQGSNKVLFVIFGVIGALVLLLCCLVLSSFLFCAKVVSDVSDELEKEQERKATAEAEAQKTPVSSLTFDEVFGVYRSDNVKTDLQKDEAWKKYQGKKVKWSGVVREVTKKEGLWGQKAGFEMVVELRYSKSGAFDDFMVAVVTLMESEKEKALELSQGNRVTFTGFLDRWSFALGTRFHITHGTLVE